MSSRRVGPRSTLQIGTDDQWRVVDLVKLLDAIGSLYAVYSIVSEPLSNDFPGRELNWPSKKWSRRRRPSDYGLLTRARRIERQLRIVAINIGSPGFVSIEGGQIIAQVRELVKDLQWRNRTERTADELRVQKQKVELLREQIAALKDLGYSPIEIRRLLSEANYSVNVLDTGIRQGRIA